MDDLLKNPFVLVFSGAVLSWIAQRVLNFMANPAKTQLEALKQAQDFKNEALTVILNNNTEAMKSLAAIVSDHEARVQVLEDFKLRHDPAAS